GEPHDEQKLAAASLLCPQRAQITVPPLPPSQAPAMRRRSAKPPSPRQGYCRPIWPPRAPCAGYCSSTRRRYAVASSKASTSDESDISITKIHPSPYGDWLSSSGVSPSAVFTSTMLPLTGA